MLSGKPFQPWASGLATAFATSFAYLRIIGTPKNIIVYGLARYPGTGERILHLFTLKKPLQTTFQKSFIIRYVSISSHIKDLHKNGFHHTPPIRASTVTNTGPRTSIFLLYVVMYLLAASSSLTFTSLTLLTIGTRIFTPVLPASIAFSIL